MTKFVLIFLPYLNYRGLTSMNRITLFSSFLFIMSMSLFGANSADARMEFVGAGGCRDASGGPGEFIILDQ